MKKLLALILSVVMAAGCFTACSAPAESTSEETNSESEIVETVEGIDITKQILCICLCDCQELC